LTQQVKIVILGAGSWGATLAWLLGNSGKEVSLYTREAAKAELINQRREIKKPIPVKIPDSVMVSSDLKLALDRAGIIIFACTSQSIRTAASEVAKYVSAEALPQSGARANTETGRELPVLVSAVKGLELQALFRMSEVLAEVMPRLNVCALSGPNLAAELLQGLPAASVIACKDIAIAKKLQSELSVPKLRLYTNEDIIGVELGGGLKNVIAIAAGGCDGLHLGANAKAALITRGLAEMTRLAVQLGARPSTLSGLAGMGDLLATCAGPLSRNYRLGWELARGTRLEKALHDIGAVVEGVTTARAACEMASILKLELPIAKEVDDALRGKTSPESAIMNLMNRPLASEQG
jgi:glycerol-3-phosphate dehydrogenase (NAD(P)+)